MTTFPVHGLRFPYVPLQVSLRGRTHSLDAFLDTDFDGALIIPRDLLDESEVPDRLGRWRLADGSEVRSPVFVGTVRIGDRRLDPVSISVLGSEVLVGREVIEHFRVTLDHGQRVVVEP